MNAFALVFDDSIAFVFLFLDLILCSRGRNFRNFGHRPGGEASIFWIRFTFHTGGNQLFFPFFTFSMGFLLYRNQLFSIEFFVIDRLYVYLVTNLMIIQLQILLISKLI